MCEMKIYNENEKLSILLINIAKKFLIGCISIDELNLLLSFYDEF